MRATAAALLCLLALDPVPLRAQSLTCAPYPFEALPGLRAAIDALGPVISDYPGLGHTLRDDVEAICTYSGPNEAQGYFEPETRRIMVSDALPVAMMQAVLVHELRHVAQFENAVCPSTDLAMHDYAQAIFAMEADASVTSLVIANALRRGGAPGMWQALADWPMQSDIAAAFDDSLTAGTDLAGAASAAFDAWYQRPDRVEAYYIAACSDYLDEMDRSHRLPRYESLQKSFFSALCQLPDGARYACGAPETGARGAPIAPAPARSPAR